MRVLQLNMHYRGTGADRCARELYEDLPAMGIESRMWVSTSKPGDPPGVQPVQGRWERFLAPLEAFPDLGDRRHRGCIDKLRSISRGDFDLVHIHNVHSGSFSIRAVYELAERIPCVWTLHDEWAPNRGLTYNLTGKISPREARRISRGLIRYVPYNRYHENFKWRWTRRFLRQWLPQPKLVICPSQYMSDLTSRAGVFPNSEIVHIPNGTHMPDLPDAAMPREKAKASLGLLPNKPVLLMASVDLSQAHKGTQLGIAAIRKMEQREGLQILLVGSAGSELAQSLGSIRTFCMSAADDATLARIYRASDVTIVPSLGENLPYVGLESLACGTPLVAFKIGGMPEIVGHNERGIICETLDPGEMSRHLSHLLSSPAIWQKMSIQGSTWVREKCGMNTYLRTIARIYENVVSECSRRALADGLDGSPTNKP